ncbi:hypothetical protein SPACI_034950 [Sporomusa acidovorans DSM 3132]|uniref:Uncharacterized protein n=1 Tax=Sporomusa acidovorans (strain ATCC 49682 / DSM 3132 / Mol) TaxID=1123286 RepID=A0ABZ3J5S7_SPOA4|nr:hypothetical protein SPACI_40240 [Sporomusa acidovorans DSM 3132]SDF75548.1 hypothetical protein SAMN04488499_107725 [Sporomusa acidovorans]
MLTAFGGRQPVVVMKRSNDRGAKGHSQSLCNFSNSLSGKAWTIPDMKPAGTIHRKENAGLEQQSDYPILKPPTDEAGLQHILDQLYANTKAALEQNKLPKFHSLLELISSSLPLRRPFTTSKPTKAQTQPESIRLPCGIC